MNVWYKQTTRENLSHAVLSPDNHVMTKTNVTKRQLSIFHQGHTTITSTCKQTTLLLSQPQSCLTNWTDSLVMTRNDNSLPTPKILRTPSRTTKFIPSLDGMIKTLKITLSLCTEPIVQSSWHMKDILQRNCSSWSILSWASADLDLDSSNTDDRTWKGVEDGSCGRILEGFIRCEGSPVAREVCGSLNNDPIPAALRIIYIDLPWEDILFTGQSIFRRWWRCSLADRRKSLCRCLWRWSSGCGRLCFGWAVFSRTLSDVDDIGWTFSELVHADQCQLVFSKWKKAQLLHWILDKWRMALDKDRMNAEQSWFCGGKVNLSWLCCTHNATGVHREKEM